MNGKRCFFIGHRETPDNVLPILQEAVNKHIEDDGVTEFIVGHYGNFDYLAAKAVTAAKQLHPDITLSLLIPYHPAERPIKKPNREYLEAAYNIAYDNVTILLDEQRKLNATYLDDVQELTVPEPDYRFMTEKEKEEAEKEYKAEQKRLKAYNKALKDARETELPPLYEPLVLNCDLLFALADEMGISSKEKAEIEDILQTDKNGVFLSKPVNDRYSFTTAKTDYNIEFTKDKIVIPAELLTVGAEVVVSVSDGGNSTTFNDCVVSKVVREGDTIGTFKATITSKLMNDYGWTENSKVTVKIINADDDNPLVFKFKVVEFKDNWLIADKAVFLGFLPRANCPIGKKICSIA